MNEEFACIRRVAQAFPYVSMDTEFPGVVAKPTGTFRNNSDYQCVALLCVWLTVTLRQPAALSTAMIRVLQVPVLEDERRHTARDSNRCHLLRRRRQLPRGHTLYMAVPLLFQLAERHVRAIPFHPPPSPPPPAAVASLSCSRQQIRRGLHPAAALCWYLLQSRNRNCSCQGSSP